MHRNFFTWSQRDTAEEKAEKRLKKRKILCVRKTTQEMCAGDAGHDLPGPQRDF